ncbi:MAG TPA: glycosyltransferase family 39 protein [Thermoanaerobaculia bacterium]|nr:glycosyltransferase family 39 protein [Thermoanaerobaculia bacterium]
MSTSTIPLPSLRRFLDDLGALAVRRYAACAALVLALMAWNVFAGLGSVAINDSDEARYGVSAWEMLQNRSFIVTTYAGQPEYWNLKPPLGYWLMALSFWIFGPTPFALRLPAALCAIGVAAVAMAISRRWLGRRESLLTGLFLSTAYGFLTNHGARSGDLDSPLTLLLLVAAFEVSRLEKSPWRIVSVGALLGLGFLLKSFAILPVIAWGGLYTLWTGSWRRQKLLPCLLAFLAFASPIVAWAALRVRADGSAHFLRRMVLEDLFARSTSVIDKVTYRPLGYVGALLDRFAPWPLLILAAAFLAAWQERFRLKALGRRLARGRLPLLLHWALVPLLLFSVSRTQHHWYLDPTYPAWAMLAAIAVLALVRQAPLPRRRAALAACILVPLALCEVRVLYRVLLAERMPSSQRFLASLKEHRMELGAELQTGALQHSERFILEAMDGFAVREAETDKPAAPSGPFDQPSVLIAKAAPGPRPQPQLGSGIFLETRDYLLFQGANDIAGRAVPIRPRSRHVHRPPRLWRGPRSRAFPS